MKKSTKREVLGCAQFLAVNAVIAIPFTLIAGDYLVSFLSVCFASLIMFGIATKGETILNRTKDD